MLRVCTVQTVLQHATRVSSMFRVVSEKLKAPAGERLDVIPPPLLRKYVAYARKYVRPRLSKEAAGVLQRFYLRLRAQRGNQDCTPVTTRQLESLIRLTEVCQLSNVLVAH